VKLDEKNVNVKARFFAQKALPKENAVISTTAYGIDV
jgi:hypothetical protein